MCNHGNRSSTKYCFLGLKPRGLIKCSDMECVRVISGSDSHVKVDPHLAQKPRRVCPGVESNFVISPWLPCNPWVRRPQRRQPARRYAFDNCGNDTNIHSSVPHSRRSPPHRTSSHLQTVP